MEKQNLYQRINSVCKSIRYIQKDKTVSAGAAGGYRAVTHDQVTAMVRPHMVEHGIISWPVLVDSVSNPVPEGAKQFRYEATYDIHFANTDDPGDEIIVRIQSHAMDNGDKAPGKALSYAKKYALLKLFELETGEDDESRVRDEFDPAQYIQAIQSAENMAALKEAYAAGFSAAGDAKDKSAQKEIIAAKDARKKEIEAAK
jgi:hypothetical protein